MMILSEEEAPADCGIRYLKHMLQISKGAIMEIPGWVGTALVIIAYSPQYII
jgi:hypothetical protein